MKMCLECVHGDWNKKSDKCKECNNLDKFVPKGNAFTHRSNLPMYFDDGGLPESG